MPKPMTMTILVEEIAFGRVFRALDTMPGVVAIELRGHGPHADGAYRARGGAGRNSVLEAAVAPRPLALPPPAKGKAKPAGKGRGGPRKRRAGTGAAARCAVMEALREAAGQAVPRATLLGRLEALGHSRKATDNAISIARAKAHAVNVQPGLYSITPAGKQWIENVPSTGA